MTENNLYYGKDYIAYLKAESKSNKNIAVVFFHGWMSSKEATKGKFIEEYCKSKDIEYISFDYYGHGQSSGENKLGNIGIWLSNCMQVASSVTDKNLILVGSSLGGWLMLLASLKLGARVKGLIGLAPAVDFTETLIENNLSVSEKDELENYGEVVVKGESCQGGYLVTKEFLEESKKHLLMKSKIKLDLPIIFIHGMKDDDVSYINSIKLAENISSENIRIELIKDAHHNLSRDEDLQIIKKNLKILMKK